MRIAVPSLCENLYYTPKVKDHHNFDIHSLLKSAKLTKRSYWFCCPLLMCCFCGRKQSRTTSGCVIQTHFDAEKWGSPQHCLENMANCTCKTNYRSVDCAHPSLCKERCLQGTGLISHAHPRIKSTFWQWRCCGVGAKWRLCVTLCQWTTSTSPS